MNHLTWAAACGTRCESARRALAPATSRVSPGRYARDGHGCAGGSSPGDVDTSAGPPPKLPLAGDADPGKAEKDRANLDKTLGDADGRARRDIARPMGEDHISRHVEPVLAIDAYGRA